MAVVVERLSGVEAQGFGLLLDESERAGWSFLRRLADEWTSGANRFDRPGEVLLAARTEGALVALCGLNVDPYAVDDRVGRVRHLYVSSAYRGRGIGRRLVTEVVAAARGRFETLRLRTSNPDAARLYEGLGFRPRQDVRHCTHVMPM